MSRTTRSLLAVACALLGGCSYVKNRVNDLLDPFRFDVGVGPGIYAEARVTDFAAVGAGARFLEVAAMRGRFVGSDLTADSLALGPFILGNSSPRSLDPMLPKDQSKYDSSDRPVPMQFLLLPLMGFGSCADTYDFGARGLHVADVGVDVALGYVGVGAGFSPGEFVDLLLGFFGIDIAGDDGFGEKRKDPEVDSDEKPR